MTTRRYSVVSLVALTTLLATPLYGEVFAQTETEIEAATASSSETATVVTESEAAENWYKSDRIQGNIQIGDFVVGPGRTEINVQPGQTVVQEITVTNRISDDRLFILEVEDIAGSKDGSRAVRLLGEERGPYGIVDFISFPEDSIELELGERARIPVTITVPPDAEPGGYYGSVLVSTLRIKEDGSVEGPRSPIIARVGSLFFLTIGGDAVEEGETTEFSLIEDKWWYESGPIDFGVVYENIGSLHVNPYGEVQLVNMFGEQVGFIELEPWFVLPNSLRVREVSWDREFLLGRYTATAKINRGYEDIVDEFAVTFWVLPWRIVGGTFLVFFIIIFSVRAFFRTFEFKRKSG